MLRAGYTKAEIDAIVAAEAEEPEQPDPEPEQQPDPTPEEHSEPESMPEWATALAASVDHLTKTVQQFNRGKLEQPPEDPNKAVDDALKLYLDGPEKR